MHTIRYPYSLNACIIILFINLMPTDPKTTRPLLKTPRFQSKGQREPHQSTWELHKSIVEEINMYGDQSGFSLRISLQSC